MGDWRDNRALYHGLMPGRRKEMEFRLSAVGVIQVVLVIILLLSLSLWRTGNGSDGNTEQEYEGISLKSA